MICVKNGYRCKYCELTKGVGHFCKSKNALHFLVSDIEIDITTDIVIWNINDADNMDAEYCSFFRALAWK